MIRPVIIIKRYRCDVANEREHKTGFESITSKKYKAQMENAIESVDGYTDYIKKHGCHFTNELAEYASSLMQNASKEKHSWTTAQVKKALEAMGHETSTDHATLGDITYAANMMYADFYPHALKDEASCLKAASCLASDPDGYDGQIFIRWTADIAAKAISINWHKFI